VPELGEARAGHEPDPASSENAHPAHRDA